MLQPLYAALAIYVAIRFIVPLPLSRWPRLALSALILAAAFQHTWTRLIWGSMFSPEIPKAAVMAVNWAFVTTLMLAVLQLCIDVCAVLVAAVRRRRIAISPALRFVTAGLVGMVAAYGVAQAARVPPLKLLDIPVAGLPAAFDGYRVAHLTDLHISRLFEAAWVDAVVDGTNAQRPDLVVVTGDLSDGTLARRHTDVEPLQRLAAPDGVFMTSGNHEYYFGHEGWMARFAEL